MTRVTKVTKTKKRKTMDIEEEKTTVVDVNSIVNKWLEAQKNVCEVLLQLVLKIGELENKN